MNRIHVRGVALAMLVGVAACGDSATEVVGDLSQAEAEALAEVVGSTVLSGAMGSTAVGPAAGPQRAVVEYEESLEYVAECELGGTANVSGNVVALVDDVTGEGSFDLTFTQAHAGCVAESENGTVFTLTGAPSVTAQLSMAFSQQSESISFDGSYNGAVDWATDDRDGTCTVDVEFTADLNGMAETGSASMSGTVCGASFSRSLSIS